MEDDFDYEKKTSDRDFEGGRFNSEKYAVDTIHVFSGHDTLCKTQAQLDKLYENLCFTHRLRLILQTGSAKHTFRRSAPCVMETVHMYLIGLVRLAFAKIHKSVI